MALITANERGACGPTAVPDWLQVWNDTQIERAVAGIENYLMAKKMLAGTPAPTQFFDGVKTSSVRAKVRVRSLTPRTG
jgi:hypothetical protein